ncbi:glycine-rich domain-containing protein [Lacrimispora sp.]|uniref:glycine-rich domain-containing protein n=1 Tax=Lacrimispora sp. TaxID=2719234 RepID=UPI002FDABB57
MAKCGITNIGGGGGIGSDELTVTKDYVLSGLEYVGADTDDEKGAGVMINNGTTANQNLNAGGSFLVKEGFHAQSFNVNANSLASQTPATATDNRVMSGDTYWRNGIKGTGTMAVQSILSFSAAVYSSTAITFTWQNPAKGPFSGVIIVGKTGSYPTSISDSTRYYKGTGNNTATSGTSSATVTSFTGGTTYYFRVFSYAIKDGAEWIHATTYTATAATTKGQQVFTSSGTFTVPANVRSIDLFAVGAGGNGGRKTESGTSHYTGGGGGGGYTTTEKAVSVIPGNVLQVTIGSSSGVSSYSGQSGSSYFTLNGSQKCLAQGGYGGGDSYSSAAGRGGSGGGHPGWYGTGSPTNQTWGGGAGASNGSSGASIPGASGGAGQGTTTRAFGEASGTLYAGGGGGGAYAAAAGAGGAGGGGTGGGSQAPPIKPTANTGGGGGGQGMTMGDMANSGGAAGICIIRWGY